MTERKWMLRPPQTPEEDPGGTGRPVVSIGPPVETWVEVVAKAEVEGLREALRRIVALEHIGPTEPSPHYWLGVGAAADIAQEALDA